MTSSTTRPQPRPVSAASWTAHLARGEAHADPLSPRAHRCSSASGSPGTQRQVPTSRPQPPVPPATSPPASSSPASSPPASSPPASNPQPPVVWAPGLWSFSPRFPWPPGPSLRAPSVRSTAPSELPQACRLLSAYGQPTAAQSPAPPSAPVGPLTERTGPGPSLSSSAPALGTPSASPPLPDVPFSSCRS